MQGPATWWWNSRLQCLVMAFLITSGCEGGVIWMRSCINFEIYGIYSLSSITVFLFRSRKDSSTVLDPSKYIALVRALSKNGRIEGGFKIVNISVTVSTKRFKFLFRKFLIYSCVSYFTWWLLEVQAIIQIKVDQAWNVKASLRMCC